MSGGAYVCDVDKAELKQNQEQNPKKFLQPLLTFATQCREVEKENEVKA